MSYCLYQRTFTGFQKCIDPLSLTSTFLKMIPAKLHTKLDVTHHFPVCTATCDGKWWGFHWPWQKKHHINFHRPPSTCPPLQHMPFNARWKTAKPFSPKWFARCKPSTVPLRPISTVPKPNRYLNVPLFCPAKLLDRSFGASPVYLGSTPEPFVHTRPVFQKTLAFRVVVW